MRAFTHGCHGLGWLTCINFLDGPRTPIQVPDLPGAFDDIVEVFLDLPPPGLSGVEFEDHDHIRLGVNLRQGGLGGRFVQFDIFKFIEVVDKIGIGDTFSIKIIE